MKKPINFRLDDALIKDAKAISTMFNKSLTEFVEECMATQIATLKQAINVDNCVRCGTLASVSELEESAKYGSYQFKRICDNCCTDIDAEADNEIQSWA